MTIRDELLMTADVARLCDVTPAAVREWEKAGKLRAAKTVTGRRVFVRKDVDRFLAERRAIEAERVAAR